MYTIFISYRRGDTAGYASSLQAELEKVYGRGKVFLDAREIEPGEPFPETIRAAAAGARVVLALISRRWATIEGADGRRRLDDPDDWVVQELALGLAKDDRVIPVTLEKTPMPPPSALPEPLRALPELQAISLTSEGMREDLKRLRKAIDRRLKRGRGRSPLAWALLAAGGGFLIAALGWVTHLQSALPGGSWLRSAALARLASSEAPGFDDRVAVREIAEGEEEDVSPAERAALRSGYANLLGDLTEAGARAAVFDLHFEYPGAFEPELEGADETTAEAGREADRLFLASIQKARSAGLAVIVGRRSAPAEDDLAPAEEETLPTLLRRELRKEWGLVALWKSKLGGGSLFHLELARLRNDPQLDASGWAWPSLALRAAMHELGATGSRYDRESGRLELVAAAGEVRLAIPVDLVANRDRSGRNWYPLLAYFQLVDPELLLQEPTSWKDKLVVLGSSREGPRADMGELVGYQMHAQVLSQLLAGRWIRPAGAFPVLTLLALSAAAAVVWRRRGGRPLAISDPRSPYAHWLASAADAGVAILGAGALLYLAALLLFRIQGLLLPIAAPLAALAIAYLLLAVRERSVAR